MDIAATLTPIIIAYLLGGIPFGLLIALFFSSLAIVLPLSVKLLHYCYDIFLLSPFALSQGIPVDRLQFRPFNQKLQPLKTLTPLVQCFKATILETLCRL